MEATGTGLNRTGSSVSPLGTQAMTDAVKQFSPMMNIDTAAMEDERLTYINEAETVGSIPPPLSIKGVAKTGIAKLKGSNPTFFFDKIGERIAFERAGARLYEALITKYQAVESDAENLLPPASEVMAAFVEGVSLDEVSGDMTGVSAVSETRMDESPSETLERIHSEEIAHFKLLCDAMQSLGGDPTAQTPCADVTATASMGLIQVLTDPRTTFAQCLNTMLTAELTDNAGWEILIQLAQDADEDDLVESFRMALSEEQEHLAIIKGWMTALMANGAGTPAV